MKTVSILGFNVYSDELSLISINEPKSKIINTISPNSYGICIKDREFKEALKKSDYLVLDGVYFTFASLLLKGKNIKRNQGPDVFYHFIKRLNRQKGKVFFLGSSESTLIKIKERTANDYPDLTLGYYSPPFKKDFSVEENELMIKKINSFQPDILFIGMTCPKQEKWANKHKENLQASLIICIGNVFDWYAGTQKSIHPLWFKIRLGWLARIFLRPEVFKRNIGNQMKFFYDVVLIFLKLKSI